MYRIEIPIYLVYFRQHKVSKFIFLPLPKYNPTSTSIQNNPTLLIYYVNPVEILKALIHIVKDFGILTSL